MAELTTIARPYARAAFELAGKDGSEGYARWSQTLSAAAAIARADTMRTVLASPDYDEPFKAGLFLDLLGERLDPGGRNFIKLLAENRRLDALPEIAEVFEELRADAERTVEAEVLSAFEIDDEQRRKIKDALSRRLEREVELDVKVDPSLIAGAVIRAGDLVIDGSAQGKLSQLAQQLRR